MHIIEKNIAEAAAEFDWLLNVKRSKGNDKIKISLAKLKSIVMKPSSYFMEINTDENIGTLSMLLFHNSTVHPDRIDPDYYWIRMGQLCHIARKQYDVILTPSEQEEQRIIQAAYDKK
jgi:hypothetical protein